jgi:hypothetical protein
MDNVHYMSGKIVVSITPKFKTYVISSVSLEVYADGRVFRNGKDLSKNKPNKKGYIYVRINRIFYQIHRIVWSAWKVDILHDLTIEIDHIKTKSNALSNLRMATHAENLCNRGAGVNSRTGRKNIYVLYRPYSDYWDWRIHIKASGKEPFMECYRGGDGPIPDILPDVPQYIIDIRNAKLIEYHGEFARLD